MSTDSSNWLKRALIAPTFAVSLLFYSFSGRVTSPALAVNLPASVAYQAAIERPALSLKELDRRLAHPVRASGALVINLTGVTIDLRLGTESRDPEFVEQFYKKLQQSLNGSQPLGLDLSGALLQGDFNLTRLGLRVPAYGGAQLPALESFNQKFQPIAAQNSADAIVARSRYSNPISSQSALARRFLIQPQTAQTDTLVFQGSLILNQTCFGGAVKAASLYFLNRLEAEQVIFTQPVDWRGARFARSVNFAQGQFQQESRFKDAIFAEQAQFNQASFSRLSTWQGQHLLSKP